MSTGRLRPGQAPAATPEERQARAELAASVLAAREYRPIVVPRTQIKGDMRLLSRREVAEIRATCRHLMAALGIEGAGIEGFAEWREAFNTRVIAAAVRLPADRAFPLATLAEWEDCDEDQILTLWDFYQDMQADLDPLGAKFEITAEDVREIEAAAKGGDVLLATSYGSQKLARVLVGMAARLPT